MRLLFRPEAVEAQTQQWLGRVQLVRPLSLGLVTAGVVLMLAALLAFVFVAQYTRKATVAGVLVPDLGLIRIVPTASGSVLERRGMKVLAATTGGEAIDLVRSSPDVSIVLMDIMMPEMDGYQTISAIREDPSFRRLPIIALTAKAMKGDREKCLEAGASEYLAKPVNTEQLLNAMRSWLHR